MSYINIFIKAQSNKEGDPDTAKDELKSSVLMHIFVKINLKCKSR